MHVFLTGNIHRVAMGQGFICHEKGVRKKTIRSHVSSKGIYFFQIPLDFSFGRTAQATAVSGRRELVCREKHQPFSPEVERRVRKG